MCIKDGNVLQIKTGCSYEAMCKLDEEARPGDTVKFYRNKYKHYGLYISDGWLIDYSDPNNENSEKGFAEARWRTTADAVYTSVQLEIYSCCRQKDCACKQIAVSRAIEAVEKAQIGEGPYARGKYNIFHNNCEHFCYDCVHHQPYSSQSTYGINYGLRPVAMGVSGMAGGAAAGMGAGLAGGPFAAVTVPFGMAVGTAVGGITALTSSMAGGGIAHRVNWSSLKVWCSYK